MRNQENSTVKQYGKVTFTSLREMSRGVNCQNVVKYLIILKKLSSEDGSEFFIENIQIVKLKR